MMNRQPSPDDEVAHFLHRSRGWARESETRLQELAEARDASTSRVASLAAAPAFDPTNLLEELRLHNEELVATSDELRQQIEELTRSCALLERERSKYLELFMGAPKAYVVTDFTGTVQEANAAAGALLSVQPASLRGRPLIGFVARADTRAFRDKVRELGDPSSGAGPRAFIVRMRPRGQPVFVCHARIAVVLGPTSKRIALSWILQRADPHEAREGEALAGAELVRELALDFRRTSTTIAEFGRLLREEGVGTDDERRQAIDWIERSAAAQSAMLDALAELSALREDRGGDHPPVERVDVAELLRAVASALPADDLERVSLAAAPEQQALLLVRADRRLFGRGVELLVRRALEGTPRGSKPVRLCTSRDGLDAVIHIVAPEGSAVPAGWTVRTAIAARISEMAGGRLVLGDPAPSALICVPLAS